MSVVISPNMNLPVPVVGEDPGPAWATNINSSLGIIDQHTHSAGSGVPITPDGLNINAALSMQNNNLFDIRSVRFTSQSAALSLPDDLDCLYVVGEDLYYNDGAGNQVRITQGGSVTGSSGTITGLPSGTASASYSAGTFTFQSATLTPATMAVGPLIIGRSVASSKTVTISPDAAQAADFSITLPPALPGGVNYMTLSNTGAVAYNTAGSTGSGAVVLATSPTISSATISSATISSATISLANGSVGSPSLAFTGTSSNTGLWLKGTDSVGFSANGVEIGVYSSAGAWDIGASGSTEIQTVNGNALRIVKNSTDTSNPSLDIVQANSGGVTGLAIRRTSGVLVNWQLYSSSGSTSLNIYTGVDATAVVGQIAANGSWTLGPAVTNNYNGQRHIINGGLFAGNVTSADESGYFVIGNNVRLGSGNAQQSRSNTATSGISIVLDNRTSSSSSAFQIATNQPGDATTTNAVGIMTATVAGAWTIGASGGVQTHAVNGSLSVTGTIISPTMSNPTSNGTVTFNTTDVTASQVLAVDGSKRLTSLASTGTGSVVRATSASLTTPTLASATLSNTTVFSGPVQMTGSGGTAVAHKTTIVSGTLTAGNSSTVFSGATVYGAYGYANTGTGSTIYAPIHNFYSSTTNGVYFSGGGTSTSVELTNGSASNRVYNVVIVHA